MRRARASPQRTRLTRAIFVLGLVGVVAAGAVEASKVLTSDVFREAVNPALWEEGVSGASAVPPPGFEGEVLTLIGRGEVRTDEGACLVGFSLGGDAARVFESVGDELAEKGWEQAGGGLPASGTFVKPNGSYQWLFVSCTQVGEETSVVVHYAPLTDERS